MNLRAGPLRMRRLPLSQVWRSRTVGGPEGQSEGDSTMMRKLPAALALAAAVSALGAAPALAQESPAQPFVDCTFRALGTYTNCPDWTVQVNGDNVVTVYTDFVDTVGDQSRWTSDNVVSPVSRAVLGDDPCNPL